MLDYLDLLAGREISGFGIRITILIVLWLDMFIHVVAKVTNLK